AQAEFSVDRLSYPLLPSLGHRHLCELVCVLLAHKFQVPRRKFRKGSLSARSHVRVARVWFNQQLTRHGAPPATGEGTTSAFFNCSSWAWTFAQSFAFRLVA